MSAAFTDEQMRLAALPCAHLQARPAFSQMNPYHLLTLTLVFAVFTASAEHPITPWNATAHIPLQDFIIQSHRGAGELSTDNTREAFDLGWQLGTVPEADVNTTKDGVIIAFHDKDLARVVKDLPAIWKDKLIKDLTFEELQTLDVGSWKGPEFAGHRIPRLNDVFVLMQGKPERRLYLDIKQVSLVQLANEVRAAGVGPQVILATPKHETILEWKSLVPDSQTLLWMSGTEKTKRERFAALKATGFEGLTQLQVHVRLPGDPQATDIQPGEPFTPSRAFLIEAGAELGRRGILFQTLPYGATDPAIYTTLLDLGFASFATDHPKVTKQAVAEYYQNKVGK